MAQKWMDVMSLESELMHDFSTRVHAAVTPSAVDACNAFISAMDAMASRTNHPPVNVTLAMVDAYDMARAAVGRPVRYLRRPNDIHREAREMADAALAALTYQPRPMSALPLSDNPAENSANAGA
jgi:hypothetical protein